MVQYTEWRSISDGSIISSIPDSGLLHQYEATELSGLSSGNTIDPFDDAFGDEDLPAVGSPTYQTDQIGGEPASVYDGGDNYHENVSFGTTYSDPIHIWVVCEPSDGLQNAVLSIEDSGTDPNPYFSIRHDSNDDHAARDSGGDSITFGTASLDPHIYVIRWTGDNIVVDRGGEQIGSGGNGNLNFEGFAVGARPDTSTRFDGPISAVLPYDASDPDYSESDVSEYLSDKYGLSWG